MPILLCCSPSSPKIHHCSTIIGEARVLVLDQGSEVCAVVFLFFFYLQMAFEISCAIIFCQCVPIGPALLDELKDQIVWSACVILNGEHMQSSASIANATLRVPQGCSWPSPFLSVHQWFHWSTNIVDINHTTLYADDLLLHRVIKNCPHAHPHNNIAIYNDLINSQLQTCMVETITKKDIVHKNHCSYIIYYIISKS